MSSMVGKKRKKLHAPGQTSHSEKNIKISKIVSSLKDYVHSLRDRLHRIPELRWEEQKTVTLVKKTIEGIMKQKSVGRDVADVNMVELTGGVVVNVTLTRKKRVGGKALLLRADLDGLPVEEPDSDISSQHKGKMHACGHDMHTAMLLTALRAVLCSGAPIGENIQSLKFVFQRAEENPITESGGSHLVNVENVTEGVDECYGLHVWASLPSGKFATAAGPFMANSDRLNVEIQCSGGHASQPHQASNAIDVSTDIIAGLRNFPVQTLGPTEPCALTPTVLNSHGDASNVIPSKVSLWYGVRTFLKMDRRIEFHKQLRIKIEKIAAGSFAGTSSDGSVAVNANSILGHPAVINARSTVQSSAGALKGYFGGERVDAESPQYLAGEDFAHYLNSKPGCFWFLGANKPGCGDHHSPSFSPNPEVLGDGVVFWLLLIAGSDVIASQ
jgi:amidohydrolase